MKEIRLFFATDVHGSDWCFRKFINAAKAYKAEVLVLGGDITGKQLVPIFPEAGGGWRAHEGGASMRLRDAEERESFVQRARAIGAYPIELEDPEEARRLYDDDGYRRARFVEAMTRQLESWLAIAEERLRPRGTPLFMMLGNDDEPELAAIIEQSDWVQQAEGVKCTLETGQEMISWGWSTPTPWDTPREMNEQQMEAEIARMAEQVDDFANAIFNFHCPPAASGLDDAPQLDGDMRPVVQGGEIMRRPVGSTAVRAAVERFRPLLGLHGHVHDGRGAQLVGATRCVNPGSDYQHGVLRGVLVRLRPGKVRDWTFTRG